MKKNGMTGKKKDIAAVMSKKPVRCIKEYYYFPGITCTAREIINSVPDSYKEASDIWPELNLVEIVMNSDSLIFQDANECFVDPLDIQYFEENGITTKFQISYEVGDTAAVIEVMKGIMEKLGGRICADTDEFEPSFTSETVERI